MSERLSDETINAIVALPDDTSLHYSRIMAQELRERRDSAVRRSLPSPEKIAERFIEELFLNDDQPPGIRGEITEDVLLKWFTEIGKRNRQ